MKNPKKAFVLFIGVIFILFSFLERTDSILLTIIYYSVYIYILNILYSIVNLAVLVISGNKVDYFIAYPFLYEKGFKFEPIRLIYQPETYVNSYILNLIFFVGNNNEFKRKAKEFIIIEYISLLGSLIILVTIALNIFNINLLAETTIIIIVSVVSSLFYEYADYSSNLSLYLNGKLKKKLLTKFYLEKNNMNLLNENKEILNDEDYKLDFLITLLKQGIFEGVLLISTSELKKEVLSITSNIGYTDNLGNIKLNYLIYLIGFYGKINDLIEFIDLSSELLNIKFGEFRKKDGLMMKSLNQVVNNFIMYLYDGKGIENIEKYIYNYRDTVFEKDVIFTRIIDNEINKKK